MIFIGLVYLHFGKLLFWLIKKYTRLCASQSVGAFILILHTHTHTQCTLIWWLNEYFSSFWGYGMSLIFGRRNNEAKEIIRTRYFRSFKKMFEQNICFFIGFLYLHYRHVSDTFNGAQSIRTLKSYTYGMCARSTSSLKTVDWDGKPSEFFYKTWKVQ